VAEGDFFRYGNQTAERILREVFALREKAEHLIVVSNQIFSEGLTYDPMTEAYRRALGWLNAQLVQASDEAWEVVCGIPLQMKPGRSSAGFRVK
jgi:adenosylcobinamide kinase/adenosylcobinamide-phosphate guanylyltransferase